MYAVDVKRGDALLFDGSQPHGQGPIPDADTWSLFVTLHTSGTFTHGFPNTTVTQSEWIYRALTAEGQSWKRENLDHFFKYPIVFQQVTFFSNYTTSLTSAASLLGTQKHTATVARALKHMMMQINSSVC